MSNMKEKIVLGKLRLGIELGSTRIKAILIDDERQLVGSGSYQWENQLVDGYWTYSNEEIIKGLQSCYANLKQNVFNQYGIKITKIEFIGISAMMHGYLVFDRNDQLLVPFRTWRNSTTEQAAKILSEKFDFNIPERWSIAHLYQAHLNKEVHVNEIHYMTTLSGYIHWLLTGEKVVGVGDASGMFPIDPSTSDFNTEYLNTFDELIAESRLDWQIRNILPKVLIAGESAGILTSRGAELLDIEHDLESGSLLCPPEGDAGTGMVATNSVKARTGNVSAGTSIFSMIVLDEPLSHHYPEIDIVTTPHGYEVAMVHANNCTSDINAWVNLFIEYSQKINSNLSTDEIYGLLFNEALKADDDCGQLINYGYFSGENILKLSEGRPLFVRQPNSHFNLANLFKSHILSAFSVLAIGMELLTKKEKIKVEQLLGHGGIFTTPKVAQRILASILNIPISVTQTSNEGGAWGMAILADYLQYSSNPLDIYLTDKVFANQQAETIIATNKEVEVAQNYLEAFKQGLILEQKAVDVLN